jgi:hypothetical protein
VTEESAEHGDAEERGFVLPGNWHVSVDDPGDVSMSLREALRLVSGLIDCGHWFTESDARVDYRTGEHETRSLHPPRDITAASYARLRRLLRAY